LASHGGKHSHGSPAGTGDVTDHASFDRAELAAALAENPPRIPSKYLYDERGSKLFERICALPEYYPTRTELAIMRTSAQAIASTVGRGLVVIEPGSGASVKTRLLLEALDAPAAYVPVDVSAHALDGAAGDLERDFPGLVVAPVCADFTRPFPLPGAVPREANRLVYFPGSTIGNFTHDEALDLMVALRELAGSGGVALVGADLRKDPAVLRAAYDDSAGVTAAFNQNALVHANRRHGLGLDPTKFRHRAPWNDAAGRIEMHLVAVGTQRIRFDGVDRVLQSGDYLLTEYSHKYRTEEFRALAARAGWRPRGEWRDASGWFAVHLLG
jgi:dimethylhistidine N-methyltransferase